MKSPASFLGVLLTSLMAILPTCSPIKPAGMFNPSAPIETSHPSATTRFPPNVPLLQRTSTPGTGYKGDKPMLLFGIGVHIEPFGAEPSELVSVELGMKTAPPIKGVISQSRPDYHDLPFFRCHVCDLLSLAEMVERHGGVLTIQAQTAFTQVAIEQHVTVLADFASMRRSQTAGGDQAYLDFIKQSLLESLAAARVNRVNAFHFTIQPGEFHSEPSQPFTVIDRFLAEIVDPLVASGQMRWATFSEMADAYLAWERANPDVHPRAALVLLSKLVFRIALLPRLENLVQ